MHEAATTNTLMKMFLLQRTKVLWEELPLEGHLTLFVTKSCESTLKKITYWIWTQSSFQPFVNALNLVNILNLNVQALVI